MSIRTITPLFYLSTISSVITLAFLITNPPLASNLHLYLITGPALPLLVALALHWPPLYFLQGTLLTLVGILLLNWLGVDLDQPLPKVPESPSPLRLPEGSTDAFLALLLIASCWGSLPYFLYGLMLGHINLLHKQTKTSRLGYLEWHTDKNGKLALPILIVCMVLTVLGLKPGKVGRSGATLNMTNRADLYWLVSRVLPVVMGAQANVSMLEGHIAHEGMRAPLETLARELGIHRPIPPANWATRRVNRFLQPRNRAAFELGRRLMALRWPALATKGKGK
jgi:hypothetical protein